MWIKRSGVVYILFLALFLTVLFRVYYVSFGQISDTTRAVAGSRSVKLELYGSKGIIYDRNLCALAGNQFAYYLVINPRGFDRQNIEYVSSLTDTDKDLIVSKLEKEGVFVLKSYYEPKEMPGVYVYEGTTRYSNEPTAVHTIGYLDNEQKKGISGVEKAFDSELSKFCSSTYIRYSANAVQGVIAGLGIEASRDREDSTDGIVLTLDRRLSAAVEQSMKEHMERGAAVVLDCDSGEILSMSSMPDFDAENISEYINSDGGELINRAMSNGTVGSVFKMVIAACALENGIDGFEYDCTGGIAVGDRVFTCQNRQKHGHMTLDSAFAMSCNSYYIALGQLLGYEKILQTAQLFGVDSSIEILRGMASSSGNIPENSGALALANLSIGQGSLMISPLEIARITGVMCNGGYLLSPRLYGGTYIGGRFSNESEYSYKTKIISDDTAARLKQMCIGCVQSGTGASANPDTGGAGGKTASAQTGRLDENGKEILNTYFTGFFPAENPKYVITVYAENGQSGSKTCAPVFKEICDFIAANY